MLYKLLYKSLYKSEMRIENMYKVIALVEN